MERVKAMRRGTPAAAEADSYRPELLADEEPRYLRRQKPLEIRRKKFGGRSWPFYRRVLVLSVVGAAGVTAAVATASTASRVFNKEESGTLLVSPSCQARSDRVTAPL